MDRNETKKKKNFRYPPKSFHGQPTSKKLKVYSGNCNYNNEWSFYLEDKYSQDDVSLRNKLSTTEAYISTFPENILIDTDKSFRFIIDINDVVKHESFVNSWPSLKFDLENFPDLVIGLFGLAMENMIKKNNIRDSSEYINKNQVNPVKKINPRIIGFKNIQRFQDLKTHKYGKFVTIMGVVVRTSEVKPFCIQMAFKCFKCQTVQFCIQENGCSSPPNRCIGQDCFSTSFTPLLKSPLTLTVPRKIARLQELTINQEESGRVPRTIECELMCDLTDSCIPGDVVLLSGILTVNNTEGVKITPKNEASAYTLCLKTNSVTCIKGKNAKKDAFYDGLEFKTEDMNMIKEIQSAKNLFYKLVSSLCPHIYGHDLVKSALILTLFGGNDIISEDSQLGKFSTRENSHILIVGDPGLGKSQMLLASADVSPRGVYVCGNSTTTSGLTVTIMKEKGGENTLEAGALVLADQGHCCIDEFDKMETQHSALLEAMEQQTISMAKSGVVCTLPARTSIIAAANPVGGHYNQAKTVSENLKIKGSLLSRFDVVFILQDKSNKEFDNKMSEQMIALHSGDSLMMNKRKMSDSLMLQEKGYIPRKALQKYILYARKFPQPKLTPEVCEMLQSFYMDMRKMHWLSDGTPITTRQLESLIRLTKARARVDLRPYCTKSDAELVIEIMKHSMADIFSDELGNIDFNRSINGSGMSKSSQVKKLINILTKTAAIKGDDCFTIAEMKSLLQKAKISSDSFSFLLESLNDQGFLLKKGYQLYQLQTV